MKPHVHAELIKQWADGAEIEWLSTSDGWLASVNPTWNTNSKYRIKDPYRELKEAAADSTKRVVFSSGSGFIEACGDWSLPPEAYEIRDKPKAKVKIKMWQWIYKDITGSIFTTMRFYSEAPDVLKSSTIIGPARWTEIEVDA